jgi:two-component system, NtrC family, response regulator AtoC
MTAESGAQVLVVDDDPAVGKVLAALLGQAGIACHHVLDASRALEALAERAIDVVVTDLRMPGSSGVELLEEIVERWPEIPVVLLTAHGSVEVAVEAMKKGAADFLLKPFDREEILFTVRKQLTRARHGERAPEAAPIARGGVGSASPRMREVEDMIQRASRGDVTVLIRGESGSGKEVVARAIHAAGPRRGAPFVKLHCAALPDTLIESELFGYEKGAFTGAASRKPGRVELAQGGTLFLDEIGDISPFIQVKLLRLLQDREFERLPIWIPPLRERPEDIESLASSFCRQFGRSNGRGELAIAGQALALLKTLPWPGNVRQLQNFVERLVVLSDGDELTAKDIERELVRHSALPTAGGPPGTLVASRLDAEKSALVAALAQARNNRSLAARLLGISRRTLYHKLAEHDIA